MILFDYVDVFRKEYAWYKTPAVIAVLKYLMNNQVEPRTYLETSVTVISRAIQMSYNTVARSLEILEKQGAIQRIGGKRKKKNHTKYRLWHTFHDPQFQIFNQGTFVIQAPHDPWYEQYKNDGMKIHILETFKIIGIYDTHPVPESVYISMDVEDGGDIFKPYQRFVGECKFDERTMNKHVSQIINDGYIYKDHNGYILNTR